jgi:hypothetical protein
MLAVVFVKRKFQIVLSIYSAIHAAPIDSIIYRVVLNNKNDEDNGAI